MSINSIDILRIIVLVIIFATLAVLCIVSIINIIETIDETKSKEKAKKTFLKTTAVFLTCVIVYIALFSQISQAFIFKVSDELENMLSKISIDNIDLELFQESDYDEKIGFIVKEDDKDTDSTTVFCYIQPKGTYTNDRCEIEGRLYNFQEKFYAREIENTYGKIIVSPVHIEKVYYFFSVAFYGYIIIPISDEYDLILDYDCGSSMDECRSFMCDVLESICVSKAPLEQ